MKKIRKPDHFHYVLKNKLTYNDIIEIYQIFKDIDEASTIKVDEKFLLDDVSEIKKFTEIESIDISMGYLNKIGFNGTYLNIGENRIILRLDDIDDVVLLGLKSKIETIFKNRENPSKKQSIINHEEQNAPQIPFINQGTVVLGNNNITGSNVAGITNIGNGAKVENSTNEIKLNKINKQDSGDLRDNIKTKPKPPKPSDLSLEIIDYAKLAIVAMVCIYVVYVIAASLAGQLPAQVATIILGIAFLYGFIASKSFRESIMNLGKNRK